MAMKAYSTFLKPQQSGCFISYPGHSWGRWSYLFSVMQSVYSTTLAEWASWSNSKSPQVFRTLLCILVDFNSAEVWKNSFLISSYSSFFSRPLGAVSRATTTIGIAITMFHHFFSMLARFRYLSIFSLSFFLNLWSAGMAKFTCWLTLYLVFIVVFLLFFNMNCYLKLCNCLRIYSIKI